MAAAIFNFRATDYTAGLDCEVCIVGSGPAGAVVACDLAKVGVDVILLEAGGEYAPNTEESIASLAIDGRTGPSVRRASILGGSSNVWGGLVSPMQAYDFSRAGGWPFSYDAVAKYYRAACVTLGLDSRVLRPMEKTGIDAENVEFKNFTTSSPPFSMRDYLRSVVETGSAYRFRLFSHAIAIKLHVDENGLVKEVEVADRAKSVSFVRAKIFVIAAGGLETPRLLLLSNDRQSRGIGNQADLVGRFLSTHPRCELGTVKLQKDVRVAIAATAEHIVKEGTPLSFGLSGSYLLSTGGLNHQMQLVPLWYSRFSSWTAAVQSELVERRGFMSTLGHKDPVRMRHRILNAAARFNSVPRHARVIGHFDQFPSANNRVVLSDVADGYGRRKLDVTWRLSLDDKQSIARFVSDVKSGFARDGRVTFIDLGCERIDKGEFVGLHSHHLGTTRMARGASYGVVDSDARVHSTRNLYISGPSVFSTAGFANPYLTIVALALRLADHLKGELGLPVIGVS